MGTDLDESRANAKAQLDAARAAVGEPATALRHAEQAIALARMAGDQRLLVQALQCSAVVLSEVRDFGAALQVQEEALSVAQGVGDDGLLSDVMNTLGNVLGATQQLDMALQWYERSESAAVRAGDERRARMVRANVACKYLNDGERQVKLGHVDEGQALLHRMLELSAPIVADAKAAGDKEHEFIARCNRAAALVRLERHDEAIAEFDACVPMAAAVGLERALISVAIYRVRALRSIGQVAPARELGQSALAGKGRHDLLAAAELHEELSLLEEQAGDLAAALSHHREFHALYSQALNQMAVQSSAVSAARLQAEQLKAEAAAAAARAHRLAHDNLKLTERAEIADQEAMTDALTGIANRRQLDRFFLSISQNDQPASRSLCVALLDIDHFKQINDRFGHALGDDVLRRLASLLQRSMRTGDLAARYGGEEFILVFSTADAEQAERACERVRAEIERHPWAQLHPQLSVTASIGVSSLARSTGLQAAIERADQALYRAKGSGRNRVCGSTDAPA